MVLRTGGILLIAGWALAACGRGSDVGPGQPSLGAVQPLESPAGPGSSGARLFTAPGGRVLLSWLEPGEMVGDVSIRRGTHRLRYAWLEDGRWSEARTVAQGDNFFVNWADVPSVVPLPGGRLAAHWLVRGTAGEAYDIHIAVSSDDGANWSESVIPHTDGTATEHGFVSLFPWDEGSFAAVWLDGREMAGEHAGHGSMAAVELRHATLTLDGLAQSDLLLSARACDCCPAAAVLTTDGPAIFFRGRSPDEVRDIQVVRHRDGVWQAPAPVHADGWTVAACPVNGPAAAASGRSVVVAWFTAAGDRQQVRVAFSSDAAARFGTPVRVDDGDPQGRTAVALLEDGSALVAWLERVNGVTELRTRRAWPGGKLGQAAVISGGDDGGVSGFPRLVVAGGDVVFAWTDAGQRPQVRLATAPLLGP